MPGFPRRGGGGGGNRRRWGGGGNNNNNFGRRRNRGYSNNNNQFSNPPPENDFDNQDTNQDTNQEKKEDIWDMNDLNIPNQYRKYEEPDPNDDNDKSAEIWQLQREELNKMSNQYQTHQNKSHDLPPIPNMPHINQKPNMGPSNNFPQRSFDLAPQQLLIPCRNPFRISLYSISGDYVLQTKNDMISLSNAQNKWVKENAKTTEQGYLNGLNIYAKKSENLRMNYMGAKPTDLSYTGETVLTKRLPDEHFNYEDIIDDQCPDDSSDEDNYFQSTNPYNSITLTC